MITKSTIDKVYETARVEEVIGDFVSLKKSGSNFKGLSPFSQERTPSFMVSPVKQIWKDFSSGKGGNVVAFLMEHEHYTYPEAIRYLANKYNIEIEETQQTDAEKQKASERESLYLVTQYACEVFEDNLWKASEGKAIGLSYFKERGFSEATIRAFSLGYAMEQKDAFYQKAVKAGYAEKFLEQTGLVIRNDYGAVDRFRGRVLFPIRSMSGRVQGFGGRILSKTSKTAKYLNSPESDIYFKSKVLYGIYESKKAIAKEDVCYLVEGYTDVIQLHQSGIENVVSSSGTALTPDQIRMIRRLTTNIVVLFDGDAAGLRAAIRGVDLILEEGMHVRVCSFPSGEDPDSFARKNTTETLRQFLTENAKDFIQFKTALLLEDTDDDPAQKAKVINEIVQSISKIPDNIQQEIYIQRCAALMNISEAVLFSVLAQEKHKAKGRVKSISKAAPPGGPVKLPDNKSLKPNPLLELEKQIVSILLHYGAMEAEFEDIILHEDQAGNLIEESQVNSSKVYEKVFLDLQQDEVELSQPEFQMLYQQLMTLYQSEGAVTPEKITQQEDPTLGQIISDLYLADEQYQLHDWEKRNIFVKARETSVGQLVSETILTLRRHLIDQKIAALIAESNPNSNPDNVEVLEDIMSYQSLKKLLSFKLNRVF